MTDLEFELFTLRSELATLRAFVELKLGRITPLPRPAPNGAHWERWEPETDGEREAAAVSCPFCTAPVGIRCVVRKTGFPVERGAHHRDRVAKARAAK